MGKTWILLLVVVAVVMAGCETTGTRTRTGAATGGLLGAAAGGIIGHQSGKGLEGAAIGAATGAVAGGLIGADMDKRAHGEFTVGGGPIVARGANINPHLFEMLVASAKKTRVPFQIGAEPRATGTDASPMQVSRGGRATALVSVPLRYMHTPSEMLSLNDLDSTVKMLTRFVLDLKPGTDFTP